MFPLEPSKAAASTLRTAPFSGQPEIWLKKGGVKTLLFCRFKTARIHPFLKNTLI